MGDAFVSNSVIRRMVLTTATFERCTSPPASGRSGEGRESKEDNRLVLRVCIARLVSHVWSI